MKLLANSNPTTIEWLMSDIIYYGEKNKVLKDFILNNFSQSTLFYHYKLLCKNNYSNFIKKKHKVTSKKYLYAFRGLVNSQWVYNNNSVPPLNFLETMEKSKNYLDTAVYIKLKELISLKLKGKERDIISNIDFLDEYIENFLNNNYENIDKNTINLDFFNMELRKMISG